ncbi:hypothetical protein [Photorhabdus heterorhabditis]|uniref:hypothetical protein n=1 Tax=Photorhabdus heterorhabditis TaxID=880156 RepID=UPI001BD5AA91|nr:hypothetical protein [Photorhabdus heterorhabditis]MBS9442539.1 hypothetical protein [Photorhabdus heterorhabditis]
MGNYSIPVIFQVASLLAALTPVTERFNVRKTTIIEHNVHRLTLFSPAEVIMPQLFLVNIDIPVIFQVASLLAALTHPGHRVISAPGDSLPCRRDAS